MTIEEAKNQLEELIQDRKSFICGGDDDEIYKKDIEALQIAIQALEKQIPKRPLGGFDFANNEYKICCECSAIVQDGEWRAYYCPDCGQAIDWSENNE